MPTSDDDARYPKQPGSPEHARLAVEHLTALKEIERLRSLADVAVTSSLCEACAEKRDAHLSGIVSGLGSWQRRAEKAEKEALRLRGLLVETLEVFNHFVGPYNEIRLQRQIKEALRDAD